MKIKIIRSVRQMKKWADRSKTLPGTSGFVPTLGALHDGHRSLIKKARKENKRVVVSVFVNPLQFKKPAYLAYPRNLRKDIVTAREAGADIIFAPSAEDLYKNDFDTQIRMPEMFKKMKAQNLEWHFRGVLIVVLKLFNIVRPDKAYFGKKDPHQLALIEKMVEELNLPVKISRCPTIRKKNGLARSSRNELLTDKQKQAAPVIYETLRFAKKEILANGAKKSGKIVSAMRNMINGLQEARAEHLEIVDPKTFGPLKPGSREALIFVSAWFGKQRLTDNMRFRLK